MAEHHHHDHAHGAGGHHEGGVHGGGGHHGGPGHVHAPASFGRAFAIGVALNLGIVVLQGAYGFLSNSVALISDAGHNLSDVLGLLVAWLAAHLGTRPPSSRFSYGYRGSSILAALFNAVFLLVAMGALSWEAVLRLRWDAGSEPDIAGYLVYRASGSSPSSRSVTVMWVAAIGMVLNGVTAWLFAGGQHDINVRGAYLHMMADAAVSAGVVAAGALVLLTGWLWLDPLVSLVINGVIVLGTWSLLRESLNVLLEASPKGMDLVRG